MKCGCYKHIKSGDLYQVFNTEIINTTNYCGDEFMVMYTKLGDVSQIFVREILEFEEKFILCQ